jgi:hypothetical protein
MPRAIAVPIRRVSLERWKRGQTVSEIAAALGLLPRTVRRLLRQAQGGQGSVAPAYGRCGWRRPWPNPRLYADALEMRRQHPPWGAGLIRVFLQDHWPNEPLPTERTLQRWFRRAGLGPAPQGQRPPRFRYRATRPHEIWQMDATEQIHLQKGKRACWLRIIDEFSGAIFHTKVFPVGRWSEVGALAVQVELRQAFTHWGLPEHMRVDNGTPWGSTGGLPTALALWLLGLPVALIWNRPHQPRDNAVVERSQGVSQQWVEPSTCADPQKLQERLNQMDRVQRERYPSIGGQSRTQAYRLTHSRRAYNRRWEIRHWSLARVLEALSEYVVVRRVDRSGRVWLYDQSHWIGKAAIGREVYVTIDPQTCEWIIQDAAGRELRRQPARELTKGRICTMQVGRIELHG